MNVCGTITGDINVASSYNGPLVFSGINEIKGNLICRGVPNLTSIAATDITTIDDTLELFDLPLLTTLAFLELERISNVSVTNVPVLSIIQSPASLNISYFELSGSNLTGLSFIGGTNATNLSVTLTRNVHLNYFELYNVTNVDTITVAGNGNNLTFRMPALQTAGDITLWNVSTLDMANVTDITGSLILAYNNLSHISFPELSRVQGSLYLDNQLSLQDISFPSLQSVGGLFQIAENAQLRTISCPTLTHGESMDFTGNFTR